MCETGFRIQFSNVDKTFPCKIVLLKYIAFEDIIDGESLLNIHILAVPIQKKRKRFSVLKIVIHLTSYPYNKKKNIF